MNKVFVRSAMNYDMKAASDACGLDCSVEPSLTQQHFAEECDINVLVERFGLIPPPSDVRLPMFGDFSGVKDFKSAMDSIALANESFDAMPAKVRARFNHDPQAFLAFCSDDANRAEAEQLGLVVKPPEAPVKPKVVVSPTPGAPDQAGSTVVST